jgi:hypothetical protein
MNHEAVLREKMTERYLLNELNSESRDEFEEHYFGCPQCALDVRAASAFVKQAKLILSEPKVTATAGVSTSVARVNRKWLAWLQPASAVLVLALVAVIAYQNLVTYPELRGARNRPQVLPWAAVNIGTWGAGGPVITTSPGQGFLLFVRIPSDNRFSRYSADLRGPDGKRESSLIIPAESAHDQWSIHVPAADRKAGDWTLSVRGINPAGESNEVGRASFVLQIQK